MKFLKLILFSTFFLLIFVDTVLSATIQGTVFCDNGNPIGMKVEIKIINEKDPVQTDNIGNYSFWRPPGKYAVKIRESYFTILVHSYDTRRDFYIPCP